MTQLRNLYQRNGDEESSMGIEQRNLCLSYNLPFSISGAGGVAFLIFRSWANR